MAWTTSKQTRWIIGVSFVAAALFGPGLYDFFWLSLAQRRLDRRLAVLAAERERLSQEEARLRSDPAYVEGLIRSTFKLAQPGEVVIPLEPAPPRSVKPAAKNQ